MGTDFTSSGYGECKHYARMGNGIFVDWLQYGRQKGLFRGESFVIENARGSLSIMVQPGIFQKFMKQKGAEARELGLWARFFY